MSITEVRNQAYEDNTSTTTYTVNPPAAGFAAGNLLLTLLGHEDDATPALADSVNGSHTSTVKQQMPGGEQIWLSLFWKVLASNVAVSDTLNVTWATPVRPRIMLCREFNSSTGWPASPQDVFTSAAGTGQTMAVGPTSATAQAEELVIAGYVVDGNTAVFTGDGAFTGDATFGGSFSGSQGDEKGYSQYKVTSSTGTQSISVDRGAGTIWWAGIVAAFKNNTGAATTSLPPLRRRMARGLEIGR